MSLARAFGHRRGDAVAHHRVSSDQVAVVPPHQLGEPDPTAAGDVRAALAARLEPDLAEEVARPERADSPEVVVDVELKDA